MGGGENNRGSLDMQYRDHYKQRLEKKRRFSFKSRWRSITYALKGINRFFLEEHNAWIHLASTIVVTILAFLIPVNRNESLALVIIVGFVWVSELFNTAIERTMDRITTEHDTQVKIIKDISAAAVLISSMTAIVVGSIIFIPKIF